MKSKLIFVLVIVLAMALAHSANAEKACKASGITLSTVFLNSIKTMHNIFPIRIGGVTVAKYEDLPDKPEISNMPVCLCPPAAIGLKISFWEPAALLETTKHPWCFISAGISLDNSFNLGTETNQVTNTSNVAFAHSHYVTYPLFTLLGLFIDSKCFEKGGFDYGYITEIDPLYNNDLWGFILNPEALLFGNPVTKLACIADAVAVSTTDYPIDPLFWCIGGKGAYPLTGNSESTDLTEAYNTTASKLVYKLHRQGMMWLTSGESALCGKILAPIWKKSQYNLQLVWPVLQSKRMTIGRPGLLWTSGKNPPFKGNDDFVWMLYRKRDCCQTK